MFRSTSWSKNMEQLSYFVDSLSKGYNRKQAYQFRDFTILKLYIQRETIPSYVVNQDTTKAITVPGKFNPAELFNPLPVEEKRTILLRSIEYLKDASSFLVEKTESMKVQIRSIKRYEVDWHKKLTLPFACLIFFFIGAPLGAIIRKGGLGTPSVISIFFFVIWYVISISCEKLVEEDLVGSIAGMWASSCILLSVGLFLTYKASTDSVIMNIDTYLAFFRKIKDYIYRIAFQGKEVNPDNKTEQNE
jgi:lipopolysaccharide export system permease protein